jgi:hypothetical protein
MQYVGLVNNDDKVLINACVKLLWIEPEVDGAGANPEIN